jgi:hypothetical protein
MEGYILVSKHFYEKKRQENKQLAKKKFEEKKKDYR